MLLGSVKISKIFSLYNNYLFSVHTQLRDGLWKPPLLGSQQSRSAGYPMCVHYSPGRYNFWKLIIFRSMNIFYTSLNAVDTDYFWKKQLCEWCSTKCSGNFLELNVLHFISQGNLLETFQVFHFLIVHLKWSKHCNFKCAFCGLVCILGFVAILRYILFCLKL